MSNRAGRLSVVGTTGIILIAAGMFCGLAAGAEPWQTVDVKSAPEADERLFLVAAVKHIHAVMKDVKSNDPDTLLKEIQERAKAARQKAVRLKVHIEQQKFDPELVQVYQDLIETADAYGNFAMQLDRISRVAKGDNDRNAADVLGKGIQSGIGAAAGAQQAGAEDGDAATAGLIVGLISAAIEANRKDEQLREQVNSAMDREVKTIDDRISLSDARLQNTAAVLTKRYGWKAKETGIEDGARLGDMPRNPTGRVSECMKLFRSVDPDSLQDAAKVCEQAVRLVPEGQLYDEYRLYCLESAGRLLTRSVIIREYPKGLFRGARSAVAAHAAALYDACLKYSADAAGVLRRNRVWMLAADNQMDAALKLAAEVANLCGGDANFACTYAWLLSATGNTDLAFDWLNHAVRKLGYSDIAGAKRYPDLAKMRAARQKDFDDLVAVKWTWQIKFGVFNDDIILTNNSAFAITNVRVQAKLVQGDRVWNLDLKADRIAPGVEHLWEDVVSIPNSRIDTPQSTATLTCQEQ